ncbi:unnamed protein product [Soboliphyme baturini]|uniref:Secreted protein n=1 Tax=Soboliphyme baturini TaxID=241478 RepID=A0A183ID94_9BILA|nr:unnamed protein product [Soboliphyme baturini]
MLTIVSFADRIEPTSLSMAEPVFADCSDRTCPLPPEIARDTLHNGNFLFDRRPRIRSSLRCRCSYFFYFMLKLSSSPYDGTATVSNGFVDFYATLHLSNPYHYN